MSIFAKTKASNGGGNGGSFEVPSADTHPACFLAAIDMGTHEEDYQGTSSEKRKIVICWELDETDSTGKRFVVGKEYTYSSHEKAAFRLLVEAIRKKKFEDQEDFDWEDVLFPLIDPKKPDGPRVGRTCTVTIAHDKKGDRTYHKIAGIAPAVKGSAQVKPSRPVTLWAIGCGQPFPTVDWLPWIYGEKPADKVKRSKEVQEIRAKVNGAMKAQPVAAFGEEAPPTGQEDDIPF